MRPTAPTAAVFLALGLGTVVATTTQCTDDATAAAPTVNRIVEPRDRVKLLLSGSMLGRLEPCGCASGQLGGLPRRIQHIGEQRDYDLLLEGGNLVTGATELDLLKGFTALQVLSAMHPYDALGVGTNDLELPMDQWCDFLAMVPTVASDLESTLENWPGMPYVEKEVRGQRIRVASFTLKLPSPPAGEELPFTLVPPTAAWRNALSDAAADTLRVLMFHGTDSEAREIVPQLEPKPDLVACFDQSYSEPGAQPEIVAGVPVVFPGVRGRVMLELTLARTEDGPSVGYTQIPLPASKTVPGGGGDPDVKQMLLMHREQVAADGVLQKLAEQRPTHNGAKYVGSATCRGCHPTAYSAWAASTHAHAWRTLVDAEKDPKRYGWPVTKYPDCVSCHVVGYGEVSGFVDARRTAHLTDVGCERCHGAGSEHVLNPAGKPLGIIGDVAPSLMCAECHDFEQSPDFLYGDRWAKIQHGREPHMPPKKPKDEGQKK